MNTKFWILRFISVLIGASLIIFIAQYVKSDSSQYAFIQSAIWGPATALIYIIVLFFKLKHNPACAIKK